MFLAMNRFRIAKGFEEGFEKVWHSLVHSKAEKQHAVQSLKNKLADPAVDPVKLERRKISGAIRTDFILSAEIIVITLGVTGDASLAVRAAVLSTIALAMTIGVYGLVAGIVKIDDLGLRLADREPDTALARFKEKFGHLLLALAPRFMRLLTIVGTAAMFLVGGGIVVHGIHAVYELYERLAAALGLQGGLAAAILEQAYNGGTGVLVGAVSVLLFTLGKTLVPASSVTGTEG